MIISITYDNQSVSQELSAGKSPLTLTPPAGSKLLRIQLAIPLIDIQGFWCPAYATRGAEPSAILPWRFDFDCGAQCHAPILCFVNMSGRNRATVALTDIWDDAHFHSEINQENCSYEVTVQVAISPETAPFQIYFSDADSTLQEQLDHWRGLLPISAHQVNDAAWQPVFCTWYAVHGAVTQQWIEDNAPTALELGFQTLIVDDGWSYPEKKRVTPKTITHWYEHVADWTVSQAKFPSFAEHVHKIHALGMKYMLWVAPHLLGEDSRFLAENPEAALPGPATEGHYQLDVCNGRAAAKLQADLRDLMAKWNLDGLKIDFLDEVPPSIDKPCGRQTGKFIEALHDAICAVNPRALIEFRQGYGTPANLNYATQFRAGDAPFDFVLNFSRIIQLRLLLGDAVPIHADPAYWNPHDSDVNVARHLIAMLAGVPMLSVELSALPEHHKRIISFWMAFYREHQNCLNLGRWTLEIVPGRIIYAQVSNSEETIIIMRDGERIPDFGSLEKSVWILNLTDGEIWIPCLKACWGPDGTQVEASSIPCGCAGFCSRRTCFSANHQRQEGTAGTLSF